MIIHTASVKRDRPITTGTKYPAIVSASFWIGAWMGSLGEVRGGYGGGVGVGIGVDIIKNKNVI